jgi:hypothetical protein
MILVSLLGMNPTAAFPIMMGSCAFLMPVASVRFVARAPITRRRRSACARRRAGRADRRLSSFVAADRRVRWLVIVVVVYTSMNMLLTRDGSEADGGARGCARANA